MTNNVPGQIIETINLADAFRRKKRDLVEKIKGRNESIKEKIRNISEANTNLHTLTDTKDSAFIKEEKAYKKNEKKQKIQSQKLKDNNLNPIAEKESGRKVGFSKEPSQELLERLVYGKKVNVI